MIDIRPVADDIEMAKFFLCMSTSFGNDFNPEHMEQRKATFEFERSLAAFDGDSIVGTSGIFTYQMGVPGGESPVAGVTMVSVLPTHRRKGILTSLMREQLTRIRAKGEAVAALWASESIIYGRFGYGLAGESVDLEIERTRVAFANGVESPGSVRIVNADDARESWPVVWEEVRRRQPGMMTRSAGWWANRVFRDHESTRGGYTANVYVNYEQDGDLRGYLRYRRKSSWEGGLSQGIVRVEELIVTTDEAYRTLWEFALNLDLVAKIEASYRRADEPLLWMLADPRRLVRRPVDSLWIRIVDVPKALNSRRYLSEGEIVLDVSDPFLGGGGRYLLQARGEGATCTPTDRAADVQLGIAELGSLYLGGYSFRTLARAGRLTGNDAALDQADRIFAWPVAPWCPEVF